MSAKISVYVVKDDNWYVAKCMENNVASQGKTIDEALRNLQEAVSLYYEDNIEEFYIPAETLLLSMEVAI